jgi:hypothetical protein
MEFLDAHPKLKWTLCALGVLSLLCSFINARLPRDAEGHVTRPTSWGQFVWRVVVDLLALVPQPGRVGILGPINLPGLSSHTPPNGDQELK